jgi:hypothetical protein
MQGNFMTLTTLIQKGLEITMFIICSTSWAPVGKSYNLPDWVVQDADIFTKLHDFTFDKILLHEEHMVVHDALHLLADIPPTTKGEEDITLLELTMMKDDHWSTYADWDYTNKALASMPLHKSKFFMQWYSATNNILLDHDLAEYLWEREAYLHR